MLVARPYNDMSKFNAAKTRNNSFVGPKTFVVLCHMPEVGA